MRRQLAAHDAGRSHSLFRAEFALSVALVESLRKSARGAMNPLGRFLHLVRRHEVHMLPVRSVFPGTVGQGIILYFRKDATKSVLERAISALTGYRRFDGMILVPVYFDSFHFAGPRNCLAKYLATTVARWLLRAAARGVDRQESSRRTRTASNAASSRVSRLASDALPSRSSQSQRPLISSSCASTTETSLSSHRMIATTPGR